MSFLGKNHVRDNDVYCKRLVVKLVLRPVQATQDKNTTMASFSLSEALKTEALTPFGNALAGALGGVASNT